MRTLQCFFEEPLTSDCPIRYSGMAWDGCELRLAAPPCSQIHSYSLCLQPRGTQSVGRSYHTICYDCCCCCYWAATDEPGGRIYKLDRCFKEIDCITVAGSNGRPRGPVTALACGPNGSLLVAFADCVLEVCKENGQPERTLCREAGCSYLAVACCSDYYICGFARAGSQFIALRRYDGQVILSCCLDSCYRLEAIEIIGNGGCGCDCDIWVLCSKRRCYPYILKFRLCDDSKPQPGPCDSGCCFPECSSVIESIALMEAALAHILNAEGEKLQLAVARNASTAELLRINESIMRTVTRVTQLEQVLFCKLDTVLSSDCCQNPAPCPPHPPKPCGCCPPQATMTEDGGSAPDIADAFSPAQAVQLFLDRLLGETAAEPMADAQDGICGESYRL